MIFQATFLVPTVVVFGVIFTTFFLSPQLKFGGLDSPVPAQEMDRVSLMPAKSPLMTSATSSFWRRDA